MIAVLNKLKKIRTTLSGSSDPPADVRFSVKCECGNTIHGVRRATWIEKECDKCYASVFVLPVNIYPSTPSVPSEIIGGSFADRLKAVVGELFPGRKETDAKPDSEAETPKRQKKTETGKEKPAETESAADAESAPSPPRFRFPRLDIRGFLIRTFTPFRMLMLAILSVVCLTGYWMVTRNQMETARQTWLQSTEQAGDLLSQPDMVALESTLTTAVDAGYTLGKSDPDWRLTLNLLQETRAVNNMASASLLSAFHTAYGEDGRLTESAVESVSTTATSGVFIFDSWLERASDGSWLVQFPATPGTHAVEIYVPLPALAELFEKSLDTRAVFAARISAVTAPADDSREPWRILVDPNFFVLITSLPHCEVVGLTADEDPHLNTLLDQQKEFVQTSEKWEFRAESVSLPTAFRPRKDNEK